MSPLMMRLFTMVGIALAIASLQMKARAEVSGVVQACQMQPASLDRQTRDTWIP